MSESDDEPAEVVVNVPPERPAEPESKPEQRESTEWQSKAKTAMRESLEIRETVNQDLALQARRMDDLARLHESHTRQWEASLAEARELMKQAREATAAADQARSELVTVTAATVRIAEVLQQTLQALQDEENPPPSDTTDEG